jgi:hypothetical protein
MGEARLVELFEWLGNLGDLRDALVRSIEKMNTFVGMSQIY